MPGSVGRVEESQAPFPVLPLLGAVFSVLSAVFFTLYYFDTALFGASLAVFVVSIILMIQSLSRMDNWKDDERERS